MRLSPYYEQIIPLEKNAKMTIIDKAEVYEKATPLFKILDWSLTPDQIREKTETVMEKVEKIVVGVEQLPANERTFDNTLWYPNIDFAATMDQFSSIGFIGNISSDPEVRKASTEARKKMSSFLIEMSMREESFKALKEYVEKGEQLDQTNQRLLDFELRDFKRNGFELTSEERAKLKEIKKQIADVTIEFRQNVNEVTDKMIFSESELNGLPASIISSFEKNEANNAIIPLNRPNWTRIMEECSVPSTRKAMDDAWDSRCIPENTPLLERTVELRDQAAKILGYRNHAEYALEIKMARQPETVNKFLNDLIDAFALFNHRF